MNVFAESFAANPLYYIGAFASFFAMFAFLIFLRGFSGGLSHLVYMDRNADYLQRYRTRVTWGTMLLVFMFLAWEMFYHVWIFFASFIA